jgi:hypothetical protein
MIAISEVDGIIVSASFCGEDAPPVPVLFTYDRDIPKELFMVSIGSSLFVARFLVISKKKKKLVVQVCYEWQGESLAWEQ